MFHVISFDIVTNFAYIVRRTLTRRAQFLLLSFLIAAAAAALVVVIVAYIRSMPLDSAYTCAIRERMCVQSLSFIRDDDGMVLMMFGV